MKSFKFFLSFIFVFVLICPGFSKDGDGNSFYSKFIKNKFSFNGDALVRYQGDWLSDSTNRQEFIYWLRLNTFFTPNKYVKVGFGLATGSTDSSRTAAIVADSSFSKKMVWVNLAFLEVAPIKQLKATVGKIKNPIWRPSKSQMLWDSDIAPEGAVLKYNQKFDNGISLFATGGLFLVEERKLDFETLLAYVQPGISYKISGFTVKAALTYYNFTGIKGQGALSGTVYSNSGISATGGSYDYDYDCLNAGLEFGYKFSKKFKVSLSGDFIANIASGVANKLGYQIALVVGTSSVKKLGDWSIMGIYRYLGSDAWVDLFPHGGFYSGKTGVQGPLMQALVGVWNNLIFSVNYFYSMTVADPTVNKHRIQISLIAKF